MVEAGDRRRGPRREQRRLKEKAALPSLSPSVVRSEQLLFEEEEALTRMTAAAAQRRPLHPLTRRAASFPLILLSWRRRGC